MRKGFGEYVWGLIGSPVSKETVDRVVKETVTVSEISLSKKGLSLILIDDELTRNEIAIKKIKARRIILDRELRECNTQLAIHNERQEALHIAAAKLQLIPDQLDRAYNNATI